MKAGEHILLPHVHPHRAVIPVLQAHHRPEGVILRPHPQGHPGHQDPQDLRVHQAVDVHHQVAAVTGKSFIELKKLILLL